MSAIAQPLSGGAFPRAPYPVYRPDQRNHCPGCGGSHWIVERRLAECGSCAMVLPLAETDTAGTGPFSPWLARARSARRLTEHL